MGRLPLLRQAVETALGSSLTGSLQNGEVDAGYLKRPARNLWAPIPFVMDFSVEERLSSRSIHIFLSPATPPLSSCSSIRSRFLSRYLPLTILSSTNRLPPTLLPLFLSLPSPFSVCVVSSRTFPRSQARPLFPSENLRGHKFERFASEELRLSSGSSRKRNFLKESAGNEVWTDGQKERNMFNGLFGAIQQMGR